MQIVLHVRCTSVFMCAFLCTARPDKVHLGQRFIAYCVVKVHLLQYLEVYMLYISNSKNVYMLYRKYTTQDRGQKTFAVDTPPAKGEGCI